MALKLYNPKTKEFSVYNTPADGNLPFMEVLLLNILIELQTVSTILAETNRRMYPGGVSEVRKDVTEEI